jgi:hypothetical protein
MMKIQIKSTVEFEKLKDFQSVDPILLTRNRIAIQQILDSESTDNLIDRLQPYCENFDIMFDELIKSRHEPLRLTPLFSWQLGETDISSACWQVERVIPKLLLAQVYLEKGNKALPDYKSASDLYSEAIGLHNKIIENLSSWKWKNSDMNHVIFQKSWHDSVVSNLQCLQHLAMLSVGINKNLPNKTLLTVAERAVKSAAMSISQWSSKYEPENLLPISQALQMYYSSKVLWQNEKYGSSIHRLSNLARASPADSNFEAISTELEKVGMLLSENNRINNGAYFDTVEMGEPLKSIEDMLKDEKDESKE